METATLLRALPLICPLLMASAEAQESHSISVALRLESGEALGGLPLRLSARLGDGTSYRAERSTDGDGLAQIPTRWPALWPTEGASGVSDVTVTLARRFGSWRVGIGDPARSVPRGASAIDFVLDECLLRVADSQLGPWSKSDARISVVQIDQAGKTLASTSGVPCQQRGWGRVFAPAGARLPVAIKGAQPGGGGKPRLAVIEPEDAHGVIDVALSEASPKVVNYRLSASGARPTPGAELSVYLLSDAPPGDVAIHSSAVGIVGQGGSGLALPGRYGLTAQLLGKTEHVFAAVAQRRRRSIDLTASEGDAVVNVPLRPGGGLDIVPGIDGSLKETFRFRDFKLEVRSRDTRGPVSAWTTLPLAQVSPSGRWSTPRRQVPAGRYASRQALEEGEYEVRARLGGNVSRPSIVFVEADQVSAVELEW